MSARFWSVMNPRTIWGALTLSSIEVFLALLSILVGLPILFSFGALAPTSLAAIGLEAWQLMLWGGTMAAGGFLSGAGIVIRQPRLERAGTVLIGAAVFVIALVLLLNGASFLGVTTYGLFAWAMLSRYYVLGRYLKQIQVVKQSLLPPSQRPPKKAIYFRGR